MSKPVGGLPSESDTGSRSAPDASLWGNPSGLAASNLASDPTHSGSASISQPGQSPETSSLVYTTGHPTTHSHPPGYTAGYPTYNPSNSPYNPSSPRHPGFGAPSSGHGQVNTYPSPGSHSYANYRPGMPYGAYPSYQNTPSYSQYPGSHMGGGYQSMPSGFPGSYPGSASATTAYPNSPPANSYQGSPVASGYPSPTNAYGMHFSPYGMVSGPPMYAPGTYAHAPYGHPYLSQQGQSDEGQSSGMWWFMPAGSGGGSANVQSGGMYGAQPQAQYHQRFGVPQQPVPPSQSHSTMLNPNSPQIQQLSIPGFPYPAAAQSSSTNALSPTATGSVLSASSPHQMYAGFGGMSFQSPGVAPSPTSSRYPPSLSLTVPAQPPTQPPMPSSTVPTSPGPRSPTRPMSSSKGGRASATSKVGGVGSRVTSPTTRRSWHPNPPIARSEWVMWVGNVPSDATHDELWTFFNQDTTAREPNVTAGSGRTLLPPAPTGPTESGDAAASETAHGVSSVFLISRSNCAFVNYEEEQFLSRAVTFFNGRPLRQDPRCPRLVCRVRRKDDDLRAGVGGQRGMGLHARWIQEQERRAGEDGAPEGDGAIRADADGAADDTATTPSTYLGPASSSGSSPPALAPTDETPKLPEDVAGVVSAREKDGAAAHHSGSGSTSSSLLVRNFPKRYFILKSLTQFDLNISVERGLWATQAHNESTLDRAFRTSKDVFLIFSANKSGEWFGYARMEGPIIKSQQSVSWESRAPSKSPTSPTVQRKSEASAPSANATLQAPDGQTGPAFPRTLLSPSEHKFAASPAPITPGEALKLQFAATTPVPQPQLPRPDGLASAPAEMGDAHKQLTNPARDSDETNSPDHLRRHTGAAAAIMRGSDQFELDENAPFRAARDTSAFGPSQEQESHTDEDGVVHRDTALTTEELERARGLSDDVALRPIRESLTLAEAGSSTAPAIDGEKVEGWGKPFKINWIRTEKLPFHRTRHLRNPWNSDREVKVSRDGTEVEPSIGQRLIDEWDQVVEPESPTVAPSMSRHVLPSRPGLQGATYGSAPAQPKAATRSQGSRQV
ncbi:hypothetical protein BDV93DRAFT_16238 [Ceratobasidium sp. AG-I]|nr:hypothetical protein BDV93DRAFT_16238 [Ceratobasidium sp. AG-I]